MNARLTGGPITGDALRAYEKNFELMDSDEDGKITKEEAGVLLRALGQNPTDAELQEILDDCPAYLDFNGFMKFFQAKYREVLTSLGEAVSEEDIEAILREAHPDAQGNFDYVELAKSLCAGPKGIPTITT